MKSGDHVFGWPRSAFYLLASLVVLSVGVFLVGALGKDTERLWASWLAVSYYLLGLGLGGAVLLSLFAVTGARWSKIIEPAAEKMTLLLLPGAVGMAVVLIAYPSLYPWTRFDGPSAFASAFQEFWLSRAFFLLRAMGYLGAWLTMTYFLIRSRRQQVAPAANVRSVGMSAFFLVVFAFTIWLASTDWIMSLEPNWSSTIFGVYHFSGLFVSALAALIVLAIYLDQRRALPGRLSREHLQDLATLLFAFSSFWMYIWFSQYLVIWYTNNPEEAPYYVLRQFDPWQPLFLANLTLNWVVPFFVLLFRPAKENARVLLSVALIVLLGRWLDLCLMILPTVAAQGPAFEIGDLVIIPGAIGLAALLLARPSSAPRTPMTAA